MPHYHQLLVRQGRRNEATEAIFWLLAKKYPHTWVRTGCHYFIFLSVCVCVLVCVTFFDFTDCESCTRPICTNPVYMEASMVQRVRRDFLRAVLRWRLSLGCCRFSAEFWVGRDFFVGFCFSICFFVQTHRACCKFEGTLPVYLFTSIYIPV